MLMRISEEPELVLEKPGDYWRAPSIARAYDVRRFHNLKGCLYRWREERIFTLALSGLPAGSIVLDAACGTGRITALLRHNGFRAIGCDISHAMLTVARGQLTAAGVASPLVENNVEHLPYRARSFDAVTCAGLLMHLDARTRINALREFARVSRGPLVVQYGCVGTLLHVREQVTGRPAGNVRYPVTEAEMRLDFERSGLRERSRFWILRGLSSSVVLTLTR
jgi:SAM-dependent methyltransferase